MKNQNSNFSTIKYKLTGIAPLIMHNGQTTDPLNRFSKMLKEVTSKRKKTDADHLELSRIEFHAGLYVNNENKLIIPAQNISSCLIEGAKKSKLGTQFKSSVFVFDDSKLIFEDNDKTPNELWYMSEKYVSRAKVGVNGSSVIRTRPIFKKWSLETEVSFNSELVNESEVTKAMQDAGIQCGLCDWTPQNGRFKVEKID